MSSTAGPQGSRSSWVPTQGWATIASTRPTATARSACQGSASASRSVTMRAMTRSAGRREQLVPVRDVVVYRPVAGTQPHGERQRGGTLHAYAQLKVPENWLACTNAADGAAVSARVAAEFDGWAPELTALITDTDTAPVARPLYTLPCGHRWDRVPGVTLLGDAAQARTWPCSTAPSSAGPSPRTRAMSRWRWTSTSRPCSRAPPKQQEPRTPTTSCSAATRPTAGSP
jgi:hypothetical protein